MQLMENTTFVGGQSCPATTSTCKKLGDCNLPHGVRIGISGGPYMNTVGPYAPGIMYLASHGLNLRNRTNGGC